MDCLTLGLGASKFILATVLKGRTQPKGAVRRTGFDQFIKRKLEITEWQSAIKAATSNVDELLGDDHDWLGLDLLDLVLNDEMGAAQMGIGVKQ